jgi:putative transposase
VIALLKIAAVLLTDALRLVFVSLRSRRSLAGENLFLRRQLALYTERSVKPHRIDAATRVSLTWLSKLCDWRSALVVVRPETLVRWHRAGWRLLWRFKSRPGRPPTPLELRQLIRRMAMDNPSWGEERIANELLLKLGLHVSPRTVGKYMPKRGPGKPRSDQRWATFLRNHARAIIACDFFVTATVTFRLLYVFVVIHHGSRRLLHFNLTAHPTAAWTLQQLREVIGFGDTYRYLIHDRDRIFAKNLDDSIGRLGLKIMKSPICSPMANAMCERLIGTIRRECLDWLIPISETHLRLLLRDGVSITTDRALTWRLDPVSLIPQQPSCALRLDYPGIGSARAWWCMPNRYLVDCITTMLSRQDRLDRIFAQHSEPHSRSTASAIAAPPVVARTLFPRRRIKPSSSSGMASRNGREISRRTDVTRCNETISFEPSLNHPFDRK